MAHILGLEHSLGGILGQFSAGFGGLLTGGWPGAAGAVTGFGTIPGGSPGFGSDGGNGNGNGNGVINVENGAGCPPGRGTSIREVVIDNATGAVICMRDKKTRHRRRRLATNSDIADLTSLRAVLGPKLTMEWIATRGRR